jgi:hypothetical protein
MGFRPRRPRPVQAPERTPDDASLSAPPSDHAFITGNGLAESCAYVLNYGEPRLNPNGRPGWYFCKTNYVDWFFEHDAPRGSFTLITHNSDWPVGSSHRRQLRRRGLRWFASNVDLVHPRLHPLPLGIANPHWPHGDTAAFRRVLERKPAKSRLFDVSFSLDTNAAERQRCLDLTGLELMPPLPFAAYLERLSSSLFCVSPAGHGVDCHRTWEALYAGTVPVVLRSPLTDANPDLPMVVLDDWVEFSTVPFSAELYAELWGNWTPAQLTHEACLRSIQARSQRTIRGGRSLP